MKTILIVIPDDIFALGEMQSISYVDKMMEPYNENLQVDPYVIMSSDDILNEYCENADEYDDIHEYCTKYYGCQLNDNYELISTENKNGFWDSYEIVGFDDFYIPIINLMNSNLTIDGIICDDNIVEFDKENIRMKIIDNCKFMGIILNAQ